MGLRTEDIWEVGPTLFWWWHCMIKNSSLAKIRKAVPEVQVTPSTQNFDLDITFNSLIMTDARLTALLLPGFSVYLSEKL
jgi:hypothetical protein